AVGVLLSSPSDVPGSIRRRVIGVSFSVLIAVVGSLLAGYAAVNSFFFVPVLIILMFSFSMISVYGFRASLISFSGLFAVVLSLANVTAENSVLERALLIGAGGLWYLGLTALLHYLNRKRETDQLLSEAFDLTADYLEVRNRFFKSPPSEADEIQKELVSLQTLLNEKHETLRELLISGRRNFGRSGVVRRKLLIFMDLVDILELGMANPVKNDKMQQLFKNHKERLELVVEWNSLMAEELRKIGRI
ncbi:FUSC family membrane protein, partial [Longispora fulva]|uniref:FUSC family membrane protein n=2 Tax=Bacteria TaxID=2 RepID=UPI00362E0F5E